MPLNRFIVWVKPYINLIAAAIAAYLVAKANVLGIPGLGEHQNELATGLTAAAVWLLTQGASQLGDLKWIRGHHLQMAGDARVQAAALTAPALRPPDATGIDPELEALLALGEDLPSDDEEFAAPPPGDPPIQPSQDVTTP